ncbi:MAG: Flp pilus assembly protein CpaB [Pseudomonadota bacterium]
MRGVFGLVLAAGVALAGGAVYLAQGYIAQTEAQLAAEQQARAMTGPLVQVFVVNKQKKYGEPLLAEDVQQVWMQEQFLPETIFRTAEELFPPNDDKPRYVLRTMEAFEPLLAVKVTEPGRPAGLTGQLSAGMRAFAINVDVTSGVSGFLQPGDNVDVWWSGTSNSTGESFTQLIETSVAIVAVDQATGERAAEAEIARTVTVEVSPEQVGRLAQAQATGKLTLSLVGNNDTAELGTIEVNSNELLGIKQQEIVEVQQEEVCTVRTRKGGEMVEIAIPCTN